MAEIVLQSNNFITLNESELYVIDGGDLLGFCKAVAGGAISATVVQVIKGAKAGASAGSGFGPVGTIAGAAIGAGITYLVIEFIF